MGYTLTNITPSKRIFVNQKPITPGGTFRFIDLNVDILEHLLNGDISVVNDSGQVETFPGWEIITIDVPLSEEVIKELPENYPTTSPSRRLLYSGDESNNPFSIQQVIPDPQLRALLASSYGINSYSSLMNFDGVVTIDSVVGNLTGLDRIPYLKGIAIKAPVSDLSTEFKQKSIETFLISSNGTGDTHVNQFRNLSGLKSLVLASAKIYGDPETINFNNMPDLSRVEFIASTFEDLNDGDPGHECGMIINKLIRAKRVLSKNNPIVYITSSVSELSYSASGSQSVSLESKVLGTGVDSGKGLLDFGFTIVANVVI